MTTSSLTSQLQHRIDQKTKPIGSLGTLETVALQLGKIQQTLSPDVSKPCAFIFGADHGVCSEGVNPFPQAVTEQMLANFASGGAAMNVFCRTNGIPLSIVNMGIVNSEARWPDVRHEAVAAGTKNLRNGPAMTAEQCVQAISTGKQIAEEYAEQGHNLFLIGEMGIGNTTSASALLCALTGTTPSEAVGPGTGANSQILTIKRQVVDEAASRCVSLSAEQILAEVGGFEIAAMVGVLLAAESLNTPVLVDGFIATVAALVAERIQSTSRDYWIFSHRSAEPGHKVMLSELKAEPLLDLHLRLGEGTGAALAYPIVQCAAAMLNDMASFEDAGIDEA